MSTSKQFLLLLLLASLSLFASRASAHSTFPTAMQSELHMPCTPACTVCHKDNVGGFGTVTQPFGKTMQENGLLFVEVSLVPSLKAVEAAAIDSDADGEPDVSELRAGRDPNGTVDLCEEAALAARYGCGARIAPAPPPNGSGPAGLAALLTAFGLSLVGRRYGARARTARPRHIR